MASSSFEKIFPTDVMSKQERVDRTLNLQSVDRAAIYDNVRFNSGVISLYTGKQIEGFNYTSEDISVVIRKTLDLSGVPAPLLGTARVTDEDGFVIQHDNWCSWKVSRPFSDVAGAREYLLRKTEQMRNAKVDYEQVRQEYREDMQQAQRLIGDTVLITGTGAGLERCWPWVGLALFCYLYADEPEAVSEHLEASVTNEIRRVHAIADPSLSPVVLSCDDFATKQGPIFSPAFLRKELFPRLTRLTQAWQSHGVKVLFHSDGNWKKVIPDLVDCGVDGFYCLEPAVGMDIVELKNAWPNHVWAGGVDGVDLMERGKPEEVTWQVHRHIRETNALQTGGMFVGTSSEINPPIKPENFRAMIEAVGEVLNPDFVQ